MSIDTRRSDSRRRSRYFDGRRPQPAAGILKPYEFVVFRYPEKNHFDILPDGSVASLIDDASASPVYWIHIFANDASNDPGQDRAHPETDIPKAETDADSPAPAVDQPLIHAR